MSSQDVAKQAFAEAEKEAREKQVAEVKRIVTKTLERLEEVRKNIKNLQEDERILKMDIDDLKEGKLDRIAERQEKDPEAKKVSVVLIIKEKEVIREVSPWYFPYQVIWQQPLTPLLYCVNTVNTVYGGNLTSAYGGSSDQLSGGSAFQATLTGSAITCSIAKDAATGAYDINGHIVHLR